MLRPATVRANYEAPMTTLSVHHGVGRSLLRKDVVDVGTSSPPIEKRTTSSPPREVALAPMDAPDGNHFARGIFRRLIGRDAARNRAFLPDLRKPRRLPRWEATTTTCAIDRIPSESSHEVGPLAVANEIPGLFRIGWRRS